MVKDMSQRDAERAVQLVAKHHTSLLAAWSSYHDTA
jgi:hypothetical protein